MTRTRSRSIELGPPGSRSDRAAARRRRQLRIVAAVAVLVLAAGLGAFLLLGGSNGRGVGAGSGPARLVVLAVRASPEPLLAVVGSGGAVSPAAVVIPTATVLTIPGEGDGTVGDAAALPGGSLRTAISNMLGVLIDHFAVTDAAGLARIVDRAGGIELTAPRASGAPSPTGPPILLTGEQAAGYLDVSDPAERLARWEEVLRGFLAKRVAVAPGDFTETDDPTAVARILVGAEGAKAEPLPVTAVPGGLLRPDPASIQRLMVSAFGEPDRAPVPVIVLNGSGAPGIGESVAERLIPGGFRVVSSENAVSFDHAVTSIVVAAAADRPTADRVRQLLGVGQVTVSRLPSGLADVTIVVGKDYTSG